MSIIFPSYRVARISWGAVFAGVFLALIVYLILSVLGTAIGASALAPMRDENPLHGFGFGTGVWVMFTTVASILVGAYMAGRSSPSEGWLHGLLTWSIVTLSTVYLASVLVGGALGAIFNVAGGGLSLAGQGVAAAAPGLAKGAQTALQQNGINLDFTDLQNQLQTVLSQNGQAAPQQASSQTGVAQPGSDVQAGGTQAAAAPPQGNADLAAWFKRVQQQPEPGISASDRDDLVNIIMSRTGKSRPDAEKTADSFIQTYNKSAAQYQQLKQAAQQKAREAADATARAVARGTWWAFALLIVGGIVAAAAGTLGSRHQPVEEELVVDDLDSPVGRSEPLTSGGREVL